MAPPNPASSDISALLLSRLECCEQLVSAGQIQVAYSGGLDSTVLLHLVHTMKTAGTLSGEVSAIHIHHGLQQQADAWLSHCELFVRQLQLPFLFRKVQVATDSSSSPEEAARTARYAAFSDLLPKGALLLQAHHQDDQAETLLLHLLRGSGTRGLAGIPASRTVGKGWLLRPLLNCTRAQLEAYAAAHALTWITDHSNQDQRYERNFLRHSVIPQLKEHWPGMLATFSRSTVLCAEADELNTALAALDFAAAQGAVSNRLSLPQLASLSPPRIRNLLKYWVGMHKEALQGTDITHQALLHTLNDLVPAAADASPVIGWGPKHLRLELRRFQDTLYLLSPMPAVPASMHWDTREELTLPGQLGSLRYASAATQSAALPQLEIRFRKGGEALRISARPNKSVKKLLQESAVPPWLRDCVPLIYRDDTLLAVADIFLSASWAAEMREKGATITWIKPDLHCG